MANNYQAESEVLGRVLRKPDLMYFVNDHLETTDFQNIKNQTIFQAMKLCSKNGKPIELGILAEYLKGSDVSLSYIMEISSSVASVSDIKHYVDIVKEHGKKITLKKFFTDSLKDLENKTSTEIAENSIKQLYAIGQEDETESHVNREQLMGEVLAYLEEGIRTQGQSIGMKTGWNDIDKPLKGFNRGDLVLLGARPSMGKTVFALNLADKLSTQFKVLFFELEMKSYKIGLRDLAARSKIPLNRLYEPHNLTESEFSEVNRTVNTISTKGNFIIDDRARVTLGYIRQKIHFLKETEGVDVVFIDHIGLIKEDKNFKSRNEWIGEVSASLKAMAKEFDVNIIILSQLNRSVEMRADKRPMLSDLRDSGNLEQDADVVVFLYRDAYYAAQEEKNELDTEPLEVIIAKNRDGMVGTINMAINLKIQSVHEVYVS